MRQARPRRMFRSGFVAGVASLALSAAAHAGVALLSADRDNTLFEIADGSISNGIGSYLFAGTTASGLRRRALLRFDIAAAVPAGATIVSARLSLHMSRTTSATEVVDLHRVLSDWGEGASKGFGEEGNGAPSQPGDATWIHTFYPGARWTSAGGDFDPVASASADVTGNGTYSWSSVLLTSDAQAWLDAPSANYGWIVVGDESVLQSAKRFDSHENPETAFRPLLTVEYVPGPGILTLGAAFGVCVTGRGRRAHPRAGAGRSENHLALSSRRG